MVWNLLVFTFFCPLAVQCFASLHVVTTNSKRNKTLKAHCYKQRKHQQSLRLWLLHQKLIKAIVSLYTLTHSGKISHVSFHHFWNHFKNFTLFWPSLGGCSMLKKNKITTFTIVQNSALFQGYLQVIYVFNWYWTFAWSDKIYSEVCSNTFFIIYILVFWHTNIHTIPEWDSINLSKTKWSCMIINDTTSQATSPYCVWSSNPVFTIDIIIFRSLYH